MKIKSHLFTFGFILIFLIGIPLLIIKISTALNLPIIKFQFQQVFGSAFILTEMLIAGQTFFVFNKYGKGTPVITEPTKKFVEHGLYKYTRNPLYLGHILTLIGIFFLFGHILIVFYAILVFIIIHLMVVLLEEPHLKKQFGKEYIEYAKRVPRWI